MATAALKSKKRQKPYKRPAESTAREKTRKAKYSQKRYEGAAEIGEPEISSALKRKGTVLRNACKNSLLKFNVLCFPNSTGLKPFGDVHKNSIAQDEEVIRHGGKVCKAEPRGYGKTTRTGNAALFAALFNLRSMIPVFSANMEKSTSLMERWKTELVGNEQLFAMFPYLLWPFRALGNKPQAAATQTFRGELTNIKWTAKRIVFPTIDGQEASGNILIALPLKTCRGAIHTLPDGTILRPDLCIFDDVQSDEAADNPNTIRTLVELIDHTAMMLGGHSQSMSAIMNCTVRKADDLSEQYLTKSGWRHVRYKMLEKPATHEKEFWLGEYMEVRRKYDPENPVDQRRAQKECLALYEKKREYADEGALATWDWAYAWKDEDTTEISAIQHAYNILIDLGEDVFASECQNEPIRETGGLTILSREKIRKKQSGYVRCSFPPEVTTLTASVDVHPGILYWHVWAFEPGFTSYLIDDETYPRQRRRNFFHNVLKTKLEDYYPGYDMPAMIFAALNDLLHGNEERGEPGIMAREFTRSDGVPMKVVQCGIDASGEVSSAVKSFIRQSPFSSNLTSTFGRYVGAKSLPMHLWTQAKDKKDIDHWVPTKPVPGEPRGIQYDTNHWKTSFHRALTLPYPNKGAAALYMVENDEHWTRFADACHSERAIEVVSEGRTVYEFGEPRGGTFNHDFDCAIIARVMASKAGIRSVTATKPKKARKTLAEWAASTNYGRK